MLIEHLLGLLVLVAAGRAVKGQGADIDPPGRLAVARQDLVGRLENACLLIGGDPDLAPLAFR